MEPEGLVAVSMAEDLRLRLAVRHPRCHGVSHPLDLGVLMAFWQGKRDIDAYTYRIERNGVVRYCGRWLGRIDREGFRCACRELAREMRASVGGGQWNVPPTASA